MPEMNPEPWPVQGSDSTESPVPSSEAAWRPTPHGAPYPAEMPPFAEIPMPWESDEAMTEERLPGTRTLWLASGLAIAVLIATATAIAVLDNGTDSPPDDLANGTVSDTGFPFIPAVSATATGAAVAPSGKSGLSSPAPAASPIPSEQGPDSKPIASGPKPTPSKPSATAAPRTSVQSVSHPDRYWSVSYGTVRLDQVNAYNSATTRRDASFNRVKGLADASCYSFVAADGSYLRHRESFMLAEPNDGSALFKEDATFCPRQATSSGAVKLESVNNPGRYLHHQDFQLRLDSQDGRDHRRHGHRDRGDHRDRGNRGDWEFRLVKALG